VYEMCYINKLALPCLKVNVINQQKAALFQSHFYLSGASTAKKTKATPC